MTIKSIIHSKKHPVFNIETFGEVSSTTNPYSYYKNMKDSKGLTFDVSNQKVLANMDVQGTVQCLTFYHNNLLTEEKPGVWVNKQLTQSNKLALTVKVAGIDYDLAQTDHRVEVDIIHDSLPRFIHHYPIFKVIVVPFAPIIEGKRLSMLVQQVAIVSETQRPLQVAEVNRVPLYQNKYSDQQNVLIHQKGNEQIVNFGETATFSVAFVDPNAFKEVPLFQKSDTEVWLLDTLNYFDEIFGELVLPDENIKHLYNRAIYQSFSSFGMNHDNQIVGSNWGSYPATNRIWNKDMYYSSLPFLFFDKELCQKTILWFDQYGIKFPGSKFPGGINHSLSNSLASTILAVLYYEHTSDLDFFDGYPEVLDNAMTIVDEVLAQQQPNEPMLFESTWISDAFALGKYHTGSNLCLWKACDGLAEILDVKGFSVESKRYKDAAKAIKAAICNQMTTEGPFGTQFLEGIGDEEQAKYAVSHYQKPILEQGLIFLSDVIKDGKIDLLMHDGEESDTTLIPFYQFLASDDPLYQHTLAFAANSANPTYSEEIKGITWGLESGATFPGFIIVLMSELDNEKGFSNRLQELFSLADLDGSWWWWPYRLGASRGDVVRDFGCGKCGWAAGIFVSMLLSQYFGLTFIKGVLQINPIPNLEFTWSKLHFGKVFLSIECTKRYLNITNLSEELLTIRKNDEIVVLGKEEKIRIEREIK